MRRSRNLRRSEASHLEIDKDAGTEGAGMCCMSGKSMIMDTMIMIVMQAAFTKGRPMALQK